MSAPGESQYEATRAFVQPVNPSTNETAPPTSAIAGNLVVQPDFGPPLEPGDIGTLGPYRIIRELGRGGMGTVYVAHDSRLQRHIALKVMRPEFVTVMTARERFLREARSAARIKHDHVVTVYEVDEWNGVLYIAMELLEGESLNDFLKKYNRPPLADVLRISRETALGLAAAHQLGFVHRDIKPDNLWLETPNGRVKVIDFGLARPMDTEFELTRNGTLIGTPAYISPEQARGEKVDSRTDLFSLGVVMYRLCTGRLPFNGPTTVAVLTALAVENPPPVRELNPTVPESLAGLIHRLLSKQAALRPLSAATVAKELTRISATRTSSTTPTNLRQRLYRFATSLISQSTPSVESNEKQPENVDRLAAIQTLSLGGFVQIDDNERNDIKSIDQLPARPFKLTLASLCGAKIPETGLGYFSVCQELAFLDLSWANATDEMIVPLWQCGSLRELRLSWTQITDIGLTGLKMLSSLSKLVLMGTKVTDKIVDDLKTCRALTFLNVRQTKVSKAGLQQLHDALPCCRIEYDSGVIQPTQLP